MRIRHFISILATTLFFGLAGLFGDAAVEPENLTIRTLDGQVFPDAVIESVHSGGIDIGFVNSAGTYVLKGLDFKILPEDLQQRFGYDPAAADRFERQVKKHAGKDMETVAETEKARLERITGEIKAKFAGEKITIKPEDLQFAIYAQRRSVVVTPLAATRSGCVVRLKEVEAGDPIPTPIIQIDANELPLDDGEWSGFIYPTGLKTRYRNENIPVYADTVEQAAALLNHYLGIYSEYAAEQQAAPDDDGAAAPPDQAETALPAAAGTPPVVNNYYYNGNGGYYGGGYYGGGYYFIGRYYYPVRWWYNRYPRPPRPPQPPHPPHPPRPPRPEPRPPQPGPGPTPRPPASQVRPTPRPPASQVRPTPTPPASQVRPTPTAPQERPTPGQTRPQPNRPAPRPAQITPSTRPSAPTIERVGGFRRVAPASGMRPGGGPPGGGRGGAPSGGGPGGGGRR